MIGGKKIIVCLPAFNAEKTLKQTYNEIPFDIVDELILVDDGSKDQTIKVAEELKIHHIIKHSKNIGYGGNQKSCYKKALELNADIIIMLHPDYQYNPKLIPSIAYMISYGIYDVVLGSRILGNSAVRNGMPVYKYAANRLLTLIQNIFLNQKLSEYHTGYRAYSNKVLRSINWELNSDDFVFDNQFLAQVCYKGYNIGEVSCPARYFQEASSINFRRSVIYGIGVLITSFQYRLSKWNIMRSKLFC